MLRRLRLALSAALAVSMLSALSPLAPSAHAADCSVIYGTVSGTTRYAKFTNGTACTWSVPAGVTSVQYLVVGGGGIEEVPRSCGRRVASHLDHHRRHQMKAGLVDESRRRLAEVLLEHVPHLVVNYPCAHNEHYRQRKLEKDQSLSKTDTLLR